MTKLTFMRLALGLPFVAGAVALALNLSGSSNMLVEFVMMSIMIGGVPLLMTIAILLFISFRSSVDNFEKWWLSAPGLMALVCGPVSLVIALYNGVRHGWHTDLIGAFVGGWFIGGMYCLLVGYLYIVMAAALYFVLRFLGGVQREALFRLDE